MPDVIEWRGSRWDVDWTLQELDRVACEDSLTEFLQHAWRFIDPAPFKPGWVIDALADHLEAVCDGDIKRLCINIPPRCSKSSIVSIAFPAWVWAQEAVGPISGPKVPFLHASYSFDLSLRDSVKCRRLIKSTWYRRMWGDRFQIINEQDQKKRFRNNLDGERLITSIGAAVTGEGGNCCPAGTSVTTPTGPRAIEELSSGEAVFCFDHSQGTVVTSRVVRTMRRRSGDIYQIDTDEGHTLRCTGDHPVFAAGRGYIPASRLGPTDWVLVSGAEHPAAEACPPTDLRVLSESNDQAALRGAQSAGSGQSGCLLRQPLQSRPSRFEELHKRVPILRAKAAAQAALLLRGLQGRGSEGQTCEAAAQDVRPVRDLVQKTHGLLLSILRRCRTFSSHAWAAQFQVRPVGTLLESVSADGRDRAGTGWPQMLGVQDARRPSRSSIREALSSLRPPHRREHEAQHAGEPDPSLLELSQTAPCWHFAKVERVAAHGGEPIDVYDIEVEGFHNFLAGSVLVHNCIIIDDPNAANEMLSDATIKTTNEDWWDGTMSTRLNDPKTGAFIVVQQRLGEQDLTGHILEKDTEHEWTHLMLPMEYEPARSFVTSIGWKDPREKEGDLLWPERFDRNSVERLKRNLLPWRSAGQLQQRPEPAGGGIIKREWWRTWPPEGEKKDLAGNPVGKLMYPPCDFIMAYLDTAYTKKQMNDPSALTIWGVFSGDVIAQDIKVSDTGETARVYSESSARVILLEAWSVRLELHELVQKVAASCGHPSKGGFNVDMLVIENKAAGLSVEQEFRRLFADEPYSVVLDDPKSEDKMARLYSVQPVFIDGMVYAPDRLWADAVIAECGVFPNGTHDDLVDTTSGALRKLRNMGLLQRGAEVTAELNESLRHRPRRTKKLYPS